MAWGKASNRAAIQMAKMNFMARDNLDMVCCLVGTDINHANDRAKASDWSLT